MKILTMIIGFIGLLSKTLPIVVEFIRKMVADSFKLIDDIRDAGAQSDVINMEQTLARERIVNAAKREFSGSPHVIPEPIIRIIVECEVYKEKARRDESAMNQREIKAQAKGFMNPVSVQEVQDAYRNIFGRE